MTALLGRTYRHAFENAIHLKLRTEQLAEQLQAEKAVAEAAQGVAEAASRAKTQFFSAASHDLRQPLHAMGLFAEALRAKSRGDDEVTHLVNSINSSVDALEGLFSELLDITKIDTGGVEPQPEHFRLRELFQRLRLQYEPTAVEKGLSMSVRGAGHDVYADPVLVDRVVRNLLSTAIRYTADGGVLVSARLRDGRVWVQVWDTGVGIPGDKIGKIFGAFEQVRGRGGGGQSGGTAGARRGLAIAATTAATKRKKWIYIYCGEALKSSTHVDGVRREPHRAQRKDLRQGGERGGAAVPAVGLGQSLHAQQRIGPGAAGPEPREEGPGDRKKSLATGLRVEEVGDAGRDSREAKHEIGLARGDAGNIAACSLELMPPR